jgi:energy-coupling factor transporter transmembrane protein EcfT
VVKTLLSILFIIVSVFLLGWWTLIFIAIPVFLVGGLFLKEKFFGEKKPDEDDFFKKWKENQRKLR